MSAKSLLSAAVATGSILLTGVASAATLVTLDPTASNGGAGVISATSPAFQAVGFSSGLLSTLTISSISQTLPSTFSETGRITVKAFQDGLGDVTSGVNSAYGIYATFSLTGVGQWTGSAFQAAPGSLNFAINLFADPGNDGIGTQIALGQATLAADPTNFALALLNNTPALPPAAGSSGSANTFLAARLNFTPAPGTTGVGGFFQQPFPFLIDLAVGNAGGNTINTGYTVDASGVVTVTTGGAGGTNPGTANVTFANTVPEPSALALVGIALVGAAYAGKKRKTITA